MEIRIETVVTEADAYMAMSASVEMFKAIDQIYWNIKSKTSNSPESFKKTADIICDSELNLKAGEFKVETRGDNNLIRHTFFINGSQVGVVEEVLH